tara:strand:- start:412 stop:615 length:204 start_codon:yes stop_codon:yes gene_type:complete
MPKRTFSSAVRMPYQDAIALILRMIDFHYEKAIIEPDYRDFHYKQADRLKSYLVDCKEYIVKHEESN